jgi:hypothetical protein
MLPVIIVRGSKAVLTCSFDACRSWGRSLAQGKEETRRTLNSRTKGYGEVQHLP